MLPNENKSKQKISSYIQQNLGLNPRITNWNQSAKLPLYLKGIYGFFTMELYNTTSLLLVKHNDDIALTTGNLEKHIHVISKYWANPVIYSSELVTSSERFRLIKAGIPFIIPGKQLYLPFLAIIFKEIFPRKKKKGKLLTPAAQVLVLGKLYRKEWISKTPSQMALDLGLTKMTIGRAFIELENFNIAEIQTSGKTKSLVFSDQGKILWEKVQPFLKSPVSSELRYSDLPGEIQPFKSGLSALSSYSMIQEPDLSTFAIWNRQFSVSDVDINSHTDEIQIVLQKWSYDPGLFSADGIADSISVYLSLRYIEDERIGMALDELLEQIQW